MKQFSKENVAFFFNNRTTHLVTIIGTQPNPYSINPWPNHFSSRASPLPNPQDYVPIDPIWNLSFILSRSIGPHTWWNVFHSSASWVQIAPTWLPLVQFNCCPLVSRVHSVCKCPAWNPVWGYLSSSLHQPLFQKPCKGSSALLSLLTNRLKKKKEHYFYHCTGPCIERERRGSSHFNRVQYLTPGG